jgi:copper transport protein
VRSGDAHPQTGVVSFTIGSGIASAGPSTTAMDHSTHQMGSIPPSGSSEPPSSADGGFDPLTIAQGIGKWITYSGLILGLGALTFLAFTHQGHTDEARWITYLARRATVVVILGTIIEIVAGTALLHGAVAMPWQLGSYASYVAPPTGIGLLLRIAGVVLVLGAPFPRLIRHQFHYDVVRPDVLSIPSALVGAALISISVVFIGHSMTEASGPVGWAADAVHTFAAGVWAGGVIVLGLVLARRAAKRKRLHAAELAVRFTPLATWALVAIGISGVVMARMEVSSFDALVGSAFGRTLLVKMGLVVVAVAIGGYNKYAVIPRLKPTAEVPDSTGLQWITRVTRWEATVMLSILALTAFLVDAAQA